MLLFVLLLLSTGLMYFYFQRCRLLEKELHKWRSGTLNRNDKSFQMTVKDEPGLPDLSSKASRAVKATTSPLYTSRHVSSHPGSSASPEIPSDAAPQTDDERASSTESHAEEKAKESAASEHSGLPKPPSPSKPVEETQPESAAPTRSRPEPARHNTKSTPINSVYDAQPKAERPSNGEEVSPVRIKVPKRANSEAER